ncbi:anthrone oxygenase family protein [Streptomyces hydrogenans]|uniref:anthrone oxygenase family protein n=1 Tax=Streptomyces hydrogenans TaxID=1873719 RepID=UPI0035DA9D75
MTELLMALVLAGNGVAAGVFAGTVLGGVPLLMSLPPQGYVHAHRFLATRYDPFMPVTLAASALIDIVLAFTAPTGTARTLYGVAAVVLLSVMTVSVTKTVPINRWVVTLTPESMPDDWETVDPRRDWQRWNAVRSSLCVLGLFVNLAALTTAWS